MNDVIYTLEEEIKHCKGQQQKYKNSEAYPTFHEMYIDREKKFKKAILILKKSK
jgi:hypothetical protein